MSNERYPYTPKPEVISATLHWKRFAQDQISAPISWVDFLAALFSGFAFIRWVDA